MNYEHIIVDDPRAAAARTPARSRRSVPAAAHVPNARGG